MTGLQPHYPFPFDICPLCNKDLEQTSGFNHENHVIWECSEKVVTSLASRPITHYEVEWFKNDPSVRQRMIVGQFYLSTSNADWETKIYVAGSNAENISRGYAFSSELIMTIPQIHPDTLDKLLERVKMLVVFS